jgi:hypothetical protein
MHDLAAPGPDAPLHVYLTADRECLLALLTALLAGDGVPPLASRVLEDHLGLGWSREYAHARSPQEREECIVRRLRLHRPVRTAKARASAPANERVVDATSHEDGGAR